MHIDHINISAPPELLAKVRNFYCEVFNLSEGFRPDFSSRGFWLYAQDKPIVHLSESNSGQLSSERGHFDHVAFQTRGLNEMIDRLKSLNVNYRMAYIPEIDLSQIFLKDPAGIGLEVNFPGEKKHGTADFNP